MKISELESKLKELREQYGDVDCVTEQCERLWKLNPDDVFFMEKRALHNCGSIFESFYKSEVRDCIVIGC